MDDSISLYSLNFQYLSSKNVAPRTNGIVEYRLSVIFRVMEQSLRSKKEMTIKVSSVQRWRRVYLKFSIQWAYPIDGEIFYGKKKLNSITLHKICVWCIVFRVPATIGLLAACRPMRWKTEQVSGFFFSFRNSEGWMENIRLYRTSKCHHHAYASPLFSIDRITIRLSFKTESPLDLTNRIVQSMCACDQFSVSI